jgi:HAD superfamily hydrolase (TIGR01450 family)
MLGKKRLFLFDIDGVFITGTLKWETRVLGGYRVIAKLRQMGKSIALLGSGSNWSTWEIWSSLRHLGFLLDFDEVWIASRVASRHLAEVMGPSKCYVIGEEGLRRELRGHGHKVVRDWREAEAVVVGHDRFISFRKMTDALRALNNDAYFIAVNKVRWYYSPTQGPILSPGAIVAALEYQTGREAVVAGKPSLIHFTTVLSHFGVDPEDAVMIGDTVESDLVPAKSLGMTTVLVNQLDRRDRVRQRTDVVDLTIGDVDELVRYL